MNRNKALITLLIVMGITIFSVVKVLQLKFDYDFEAFFPQNDTETDFYLNFRNQFETDNDFIIVALESQSSVFNQEYLSELDRLTRDLGELEYVEEVSSLANLNDIWIYESFGTSVEVPLIHLDSIQNFSNDSITIFSKPELVGLFISSDAKAATINIKHKQGISKNKGDRLSVQVQQVVDSYKLGKAHVIGRTLGQRLYVEMMIQELIMFISISLIITIIFLFIAFRSGIGIIVPTLIVLMSILWTMGFMKLIGKNIDLMITVLPTIIFVVGMSDSVHVLTKYLQELRNGKSKNEAIRYAFKSIRLATFLTALTTSIGFFTLVLSNIKPISDFGIYISVGVLLAYGLTFSVLPAILFLSKPTRLITFSTKDDFWTEKLHISFQWILRNRIRIFIGGGVVVGFGLIGIYLLKVDNYMLEDLKDDHILKQEFRYMEDHFSGVRPFEMAITPEKGMDVFTLSFLSKVDSIDDYLIKEYEVGSLISLATIVKSMNRSLHQGNNEFYQLPDERGLRLIKRMLRKKQVAQLVHLYYNDSTNVLRVSGKVGDVGRLHYESENAALAEYVSNHFPKGSMKVKVTGTAQLIDLNNKYLVENLVLDLLLSVFAIGLIMSIIYKSWRMFFLTIIPNIIPLVLVAGIMGFTGIPIKVSTSIIFNIAFGIAVDDTIHFLARVRTLLGEGKSVQYAVKRTFLTTGKAMIITTLILCGGFVTLIFSNFMGTFYIGLLITTTLIIGVITELLFAPLVVLFFFNKKSL
ncbi:MAG: MMPL family transporter [Flavobacteriales bacterium]